MEVTLEKDKTTPGTVRYKETGDVDRPLTIYLGKDRVKELGNPDTIKVTINAVPAEQEA